MLWYVPAPCSNFGDLGRMVFSLIIITIKMFFKPFFSSFILCFPHSYWMGNYFSFFLSFCLFAFSMYIVLCFAPQEAQQWTKHAPHSMSLQFYRADRSSHIQLSTFDNNRNLKVIQSAVKAHRSRACWDSRWEELVRGEKGGKPSPGIWSPPDPITTP